MEKENKKRVVSEATKRKISKAMKGNKNAEVWNEKLVLTILNKMIDILEEPYGIELDNTEEIKDVSGKSVVDENGNVNQDSNGYTKRKVKKVKRSVHLKHELLMTFKIRDAKWFARMHKIFKENESVLHLLEYIDSTCMVNTYNDAANGSTNSTIAKMNLSTHHNWSDKVDSKVEHEGSVQFEKPSKEEIPESIMKAYEEANKYIDDDQA